MIIRPESVILGYFLMSKPREARVSGVKDLQDIKQAFVLLTWRKTGMSLRLEYMVLVHQDFRFLCFWSPSQFWILILMSTQKFKRAGLYILAALYLPLWWWLRFRPEEGREAERKMDILYVSKQPEWLQDISACNSLTRMSSYGHPKLQERLDNSLHSEQQRG